MSIPTETKVYVLANPPTGAIKPDTFKLETQSLPKESELKDGELLFKTVALSNDPAQRTWMTKDVDAVSLLLEKSNVELIGSDDYMPHLSDREMPSRLVLC
jgi:NADPH-dependent curcumin reductase CurA